MINKNDILTRAKGMLKARPVSYEKRLIHPTREWLMGLAFFLAIVTIGGAYCAYLFVAYRTINTNEQVVTNSSVTYNQMLVSRVLSEYQARRSNYNALQEVRFIPEPEVIETATSTATSSEEVASSTEEVESGE